MTKMAARGSPRTQGIYAWRSQMKEAKCSPAAKPRRREDDKQKASDSSRPSSQMDCLALRPYFVRETPKNGQRMGVGSLHKDRVLGGLDGPLTVWAYRGSGHFWMYRRADGALAPPSRVADGFLSLLEFMVLYRSRLLPGFVSRCMTSRCRASRFLGARRCTS